MSIYLEIWRFEDLFKSDNVKLSFICFAWIMERNIDIILKYLIFTF